MDETYLAYCLDEAAGIAGAHREHELYEEARADAQASTGDRPSTSPRSSRGPAQLEMGPAGLSLRGKIPVLKKKA